MLLLATVNMSVFYCYLFVVVFIIVNMISSSTNSSSSSGRTYHLSTDAALNLLDITSNLCTDAMFVLFDL